MYVCDKNWVDGMMEMQNGIYIALICEYLKVCMYLFSAYGFIVQVMYARILRVGGEANSLPFIFLERPEIP